MTYSIEIKEEFFQHTEYKTITSRWDWFVYDDDVQLLDQGSSAYGESDARKHAERAATLHAKQQAAKRIEYDFTPEI
jgi:hypothetical protein